MRRKDGFTLIELMVTLVVVSILFAFIGRKYFDIQEQGRKRAAMNAISEGIQRLRVAHGKYLMDVGGSSPARTAEGFQAFMGVAPNADVDVGDYVIRYELGLGADSDQIAITAYTDDGTGQAVGEAIASQNATWPEAN